METSDPIFVHSPKTHYHAKTFMESRQSSVTSPSKSDSSMKSDMDGNKPVSGMDFSGSDESDVSDMIVDNSSRFQKLNCHRRKSGGSDYRPASDSGESDNSKSAMESESEESESEDSSLTPQRTNLQSGKSQKGAVSEDDSEESRSTSRSVSNPAVLRDFKRTPIVRKSPLGVSQPRTNLRDVAVMRGYRYAMHPSRTAALNVSYKRYLAVDENEESDESSVDLNSRKKGRARDSDSDFEVPGMQESSDEPSSMEEESEEEYYPPKRKSKVGRRRKDWEEESGSDSDYLPGGRKKRGGRGGRKVIKRSTGYEHTFVSDGEISGSSSESEFEPGGHQRRRGKKTKQRRGNNSGANNRATSSPSDFTRTTGRSRGVVNYKDFYGGSEESAEGEGEGEAREGGEGETPVPIVEDNRETIERILKKRMGLVGDTGDKTTCYSRCLAAIKPSNPGGGEAATSDGDSSVTRGPVPQLSFSYGEVPPDQPTEIQYLVKWLKWSHLHDTWETEASLLGKDIKGMKKFYNFLKKEEEKEAWEREANPEDIEYLKCQEELADELFNQFIQVERVIAAHDGADGGQEYLCKWRGLPYSECTWEDSDLVSSWFQEEIDAFIERDASDCIPNKNAKVLRHRPKFVYMKEQLKSLGGSTNLKLRDYQLEGVNWLVKSWCKSNSVILADEMGLGKTIQTIAFLHALFHQHQLYGPFLIVVPLSTMPAWQRECEQWAPEMNTIVYLGDVNSRSKIREHEWCHPNRKLKFNILVTTYEILLKDKDFLGSVAWASLIVDEAHRLKNDDSLLYRTLMEFRTNHRLLITGTPLQNSIKELWSLLHFIMEREFDNWDDFEYEHQAYGAGDASSLASIHQQLQPFLLRRIKKDVEKSLPAKVEQILRVEMSSVQKQYYKWILTKNYKALSKGVKGSITGFINIMMELKKCCNHVWIVRSPDDKEVQEKDKLQTLIRGSGKLYLLDKLLVRLNQSGHRVLIFSQMVRMLDLLADYMRLRHFHFQRLDGSIRGDQRKDAIDHFNAEGSQDFCFLLSTRAGGLGVNLATADTVVIFDSDWNPQNDLQAQARAHRIGQKKQVNIYRLVTKSSVEEDIIERAKKKMVLDHLVIQRMDTTGRTILSASTEPNKSVPFDKEELNAILKFGAEDLFKSDEGEGGVGGAGDKELQEMDIDDILSRAETQAASEDSTHNDLLSQFKVASFVMEEDEPPPPVPTTPTDGSFLLSPMEKEKEGLRERKKGVERSWEELIPEDARKKVEEEEKTKEQLSLYLPPRQRKVQNYCEDGSVKQEPASGRSKGRGTRGGVNNSKDHTPISASASGTSGFSTVISKNIRGFTDSEIRRFVKSFKKYVNPNSRLEAIAADAELQEKSLSELQRLMTVLREGCVQAEEEHRVKIEMDEQYDPKKDKGSSLRLCGVSVNSTALLRREEELEALALVIPANPAVRRKYRLLSRPKPVHWEGVRWTAIDDAKLLVGVYEHGLGNWESIRDDPNLGLTNKILPADSGMKPQGSHLQTRVDYLLRQIQPEAVEKMKMKKKASKGSRSTPSSRRAAPPKTASGPGRKRGPKSSNLTVNISRKMLDDGDDSTGSAASIRTSSRKRKRQAPAAAATDSPAKRKATGRRGGVQVTAAAARESPRSRARKERVVIPGERSSPRKRKGQEVKEEVPEVEEEAVVDKDKGTSEFEDGVELDDKTFQRCKSLLKPVKKFMVDLHPKEEAAEKDPSAIGQFKQVIVEIGDHISSCLTSDDSLDDASLWKMYLWVFVSKFTTASPQKLHKIYKKAKKSGDVTTTKLSVGNVASQPKKELPQMHSQHHAAPEGRDKQQHHGDREKQLVDKDKQHVNKDKEHFDKEHIDKDRQQQHADKDGPREANSTHHAHFSDDRKSSDMQNSKSDLPPSRSMDDLRNTRDSQHGRDHRRYDESPTRSHHGHSHHRHSDDHHRERRHSGGDYHGYHHHHHSDEKKRDRHHSGDSYSSSHRHVSHSDRYDGHSDRHDDHYGRSHYHKDRQRHSSGSSYHSDGASSSKWPRYHSPPPSHSSHHHSHPHSSVQKASTNPSSH